MLQKIKTWFNQAVENFLVRHIPAIIGFIALTLTLWAYYGGQFWNIIFALMVAIYTEVIALIVSSYSCFYYTKQNPSDMSDELKGKIFLSVHVLFAIVIGLIYWSKNGG